jgi:two-component system sensor histidine kinase KdpD
LPRVREIVSQWNKTGLVENEELVILTRAGQKRDILLSSGAIRDKNGKVTSSVSVQKDITELKQSQIKALQVDILTRLNKAKSEMLSDVAHELRTPLASIKGFIETPIESDVKWTKQQQMEFLLEANKETDNLNLLIRDLLDVSRIESGKMKLEKQLCTLEDILASSKARLTILTSSHTFNIKLSPGLRPINADRMRIAQVITNLVENATKFSPIGSPITLSATVTMNNLIVSVKDRGIGMTQDTIDNLFNRFYQAGQVATGNSKGTGLGLSICRGIIEAHGGKIWVESSIGDGSTFSFSLPLSAPNDSKPSLSSPS